MCRQGKIAADKVAAGLSNLNPGTCYGAQGSGGHGRAR